jgi:hypothetical protein
MPQSTSSSFTWALIVLCPSVTAVSSGQPSVNTLCRAREKYTALLSATIYYIATTAGTPARIRLGARPTNDRDMLSVADLQALSTATAALLLRNSRASVRAPTRVSSPSSYELS